MDIAMLKRLYEQCLALFLGYKETLLYLIFGGLTTLINIVCYWALSSPLGIDFMVANALAWAISVLFAFVTNKLFVFESKSLAPVLLAREFVLFVGARLFSGAMDMGIMYLFIDVLQFNDMLIKVLSNILVIIVNYILSKLIIFRKK